MGDYGRRKRRNRVKQEPLGYPFQSSEIARPDKARPDQHISLGNEYTFVPNKNNAQMDVPSQRRQPQGLNQATQALIEQNSGHKLSQAVRHENLVGSKSVPYGMPVMRIEHPRSVKPAYRQLFMIQPSASLYLSNLSAL